jgi:hypothetical protein
VPIHVESFNMAKKTTYQFRLRPAIASLRRLAVRYLLPILVRPFEGAAEERPLSHGLEQIAGTLRTMGVPPEDAIVKQIGSEFRLLFCAAAEAGDAKSQPRSSPIDPVKSISELLREPPRSSATAALARFVTLCKRLIVSRLKRSFS